MRYYAPWMCRFVSVDPIAADYMKLTPYQYGSNDPINGQDMDGLESTTGKGENEKQGGGTTTATDFKPVGTGQLSQEEVTNTINFVSSLGGGSEKPQPTSTDTLTPTPNSSEKSDPRTGGVWDLAQEATAEGADKLSDAAGDMSKSRVQSLESKGVLTATNGKNYKTSNIKDVQIKEVGVSGREELKTVKKGQNFGFSNSKTGQVTTTKGIQVTDNTTKLLKGAQSLLKEVSFFMDIYDLSQFALGNKDIADITPFGIYAEQWYNETQEMFEEMDFKLLEEAIDGGLGNVNALINKKNALDAQVIYVTAEQLLQIQSGGISEYVNLGDYADINRPYALIAAKSQFHIYGGFINR